jgi:hypothetical protein
MQTESSYICKACHSIRHGSFNAEVAIHFPGLRGLNKPVVLIFPKLKVCFQCGFTELVVPERELQVLREGTITEGAMVFDLESGADSKSSTDEEPPPEGDVKGRE